MPATIDKPLKRPAGVKYTTAPKNIATATKGSGKESFPLLNALGVIAFLATGIILSLSTGNLFMKELLIAGGVLSLAMICKAADAKSQDL